MALPHTTDRRAHVPVSLTEERERDALLASRLRTAIREFTQHHHARNFVARELARERIAALLEEAKK